MHEHVIDVKANYITILPYILDSFQDQLYDEPSTRI